MIAKLAHDISGYLDLNWMDQKHGLVFANTVVLPTDTKVKKTLPFEWGTVDCNENSCVTMSETKRCVSFIEGGNVINRSGQRMEGNTYLHDTDFRIVCWMNLKKIDFEDIYVGDKCINTLESAINNMKFETYNSKLLRAVVSKIVTDPKQILGKYSYSDKVKLMLYPHMVFAIDFVAGFTSKQCSEITLNPEVC